jgi:hypothetical protein
VQFLTELQFAIVHHTKMEIVFGHPTGNFFDSSSLQILHNPLRQRFGRGGVLSGIEFTVDHDVGLESTYIVNLSSKLRNSVLQQEPEVLGVCDLTRVHATKLQQIGRSPRRKNQRLFLPHWKMR